MERKKNVAEIKRLIQEKKEAADTHFSLTRFLISKGVARPIAEKISLAFSQEGCALSSLKESLVKEIHTAGELVFPARLALVGPTGVGKTTTLLKLADHYRKKNKTVAIAALDFEKGGAYAQLQRYADEWGVALHTSLDQAQGDLILIDTTGCNFYQPFRVDRLGDQLSAWGPVDILLTLSASTKEVDIYGAIHQFSPLRPSSLAFTKLDETLSSGILINVSAKTDLPIRYITFGYPLPGEVQLADPYKITHKILTEFNQKEFNHIRHLSLSD
jgi:flagellar biosynthesis GTPase FlhF